MIVLLNTRLTPIFCAGAIMEVRNRSLRYHCHGIGALVAVPLTQVAPYV
jgi:hypothetical protein